MHTQKRSGFSTEHSLGIRLFLAVLVISLAVSACQGAAATPDQDKLDGDSASELAGLLEDLDPSGALVVYWYTLTGADEKRLSEMIDDFNATNEWDITVVGEYQGDPKALDGKITECISACQFPNLVLTDLNLAAAYASQDIAVELSPYVNSANWGFSRADLKDLFPSALSSDKLPQFDGQIYVFSPCRSLQVLYYNENWLKELGYDSPPRTWDGFREIACAASLPVDGLFGFEFGMDSSIFTSLLATQNASLLNFGATAFTLGGEQGRDALYFLQDLIGDGCAVWETEQGILADFTAGRILFAIDSTAKLPAYRRAITDGANFAWGLSTLPFTTDEPLVGVHGDSMSILRSNPEEQLAAWLFIRWMAEAEQQARWAQDTGCFPVRRSTFGEMELYMEGHPQYGVASQFLDREWFTEPGVSAFATCRAEIGRMMYAVTAGESVIQWFNDTQNLCNQALTDAAE